MLTTWTQWDDWVPQDRVRKFNDENRELAAQLHNQMKSLQQKGPKTIGGKKGNMKNGSDFSTPRGSEERHTAQMGRGRGRNRDYDLEHVSKPNSVSSALSCNYPSFHCIHFPFVGTSFGLIVGGRC